MPSWSGFKQTEISRTKNYLLCLTECKFRVLFERESAHCVLVVDTVGRDGLPCGSPGLAYLASLVGVIGLDEHELASVMAFQGYCRPFTQGS